MDRLVFMLIIFSSMSLIAQRNDTIPYGNSFVIAHYDDVGRIQYYENSFFMKDSTWKRTYFSKGEIKSSISKGSETSDTIYTANKFLERTESYYSNGNIESIWFNKKINKSERVGVWSLDSSYISFYANGQISDSLYYKRNKLVGTGKHFYNNGQLAYEIIYMDQKLFNVIKYMDKNGNKLTVGNFKDGNGNWNQYDTDGNKCRVNTYKNGKKKKSKKILLNEVE